MRKSKGKKEDFSSVVDMLDETGKRSIHEFLLNNSKAITMVIDRNGILLFLNRKALSNLGYRDSEVIGKNLRKGRGSSQEGVQGGSSARGDT